MNNYDMSNKMVSTRIHFIAFLYSILRCLLYVLAFSKILLLIFSIYLVFKFYDSRINAK